MRRVPAHTAPPPLALSCTALPTSCLPTAGRTTYPLNIFHPAGGGGGLKMMSGVCLLKDCVVRGNKATYGGGLEVCVLLLLLLCPAGGGGSTAA